MVSFVLRLAFRLLLEVHSIRHWIYDDASEEANAGIFLGNLFVSEIVPTFFTFTTLHILPLLKRRDILEHEASSSGATSLVVQSTNGTTIADNT
mmetsp:Transcript_62041/g.134765  ORF Transcript_62041/g.134765 Transcript_62041/m.134765 type:complete len:94 (-) Transcript_62041:71-352(-)